MYSVLFAYMYEEWRLYTKFKGEKARVVMWTGVYSSEICSLRICIPKSSKIKIVSHAQNLMFFVFSSYISATLVTLILYRLVSSCRFLARSKFRCVQWQCGIRPALFKCLQYQQVLTDYLDIFYVHVSVRRQYNYKWRLTRCNYSWFIYF
jgi:hypothetical protein